MEPDRRANKQIHPSLPVGVSPAAYGGCLSDESQTLLEEVGFEPPAPDLPIRCGCARAQRDCRRMKASPLHPISAGTAQLDSAANSVIGVDADQVGIEGGMADLVNGRHSRSPLVLIACPHL